MVQVVRSGLLCEWLPGGQLAEKNLVPGLQHSCTASSHLSLLSAGVNIAENTGERNTYIAASQTPIDSVSTTCAASDNHNQTTCARQKSEQLREIMEQQKPSLQSVLHERDVAACRPVPPTSTQRRQR
jgi:hypothetical protein